MTILRGSELEEAAEKRPKRLFTKNTGFGLSRKTTYRGDACPVPEGHEERLAFAKL